MASVSLKDKIVVPASDLSREGEVREALPLEIVPGRLLSKSEKFQARHP